VTRSNDLGLLEREAVVRAGTGRELIVATGADRSRFLGGIVTGNVAGTPVGGGCLSALLTPKGHVITDMRMFVRESDIWIIVDAGQAETVAGALSRYAIMDDFAAAARADMAFSALLGPAAAARLATIGADPGPVATAPPLAHTQIATPDGELWIARVRELGADGFWLGAPPSSGTPAWSFFVNLAPLYSGSRREPAMAINGCRNKPIGPGGSTRRLHQCSGLRAQKSASAAAASAGAK